MEKNVETDFFAAKQIFQHFWSIFEHFPTTPNLSIQNLYFVAVLWKKWEKNTEKLNIWTTEQQNGFSFWISEINFYSGVFSVFSVSFSAFFTPTLTPFWVSTLFGYFLPYFFFVFFAGSQWNPIQQLSQTTTLEEKNKYNLRNVENIENVANIANLNAKHVNRNVGENLR